MPVTTIQSIDCHVIPLPTFVSPSDTFEATSSKSKEIKESLESEMSISTRLGKLLYYHAQPTDLRKPSQRPTLRFQ